MDNEHINEKELENVNGGFIPPLPPSAPLKVTGINSSYDSPRIDDINRLEGINVPVVPLVPDKEIRNN